MTSKREAALEQVRTMREQGRSPESIRKALYAHGLNKAQVEDVMPSETQKDEPKQINQPTAQVLRDIAEALPLIERQFAGIAASYNGPRKDLLIWSEKIKGTLR
jgi:DNA-binding transcriptional MerR regulator